MMNIKLKINKVKGRYDFLQFSDLKLYLVSSIYSSQLNCTLFIFNHGLDFTVIITVFFDI